MDFDVNWLAVGVATLAAFALGAAWYSSALFGKRWQNDLGFTEEYLREGNMAKTFGLSFVAMFVMALGLALMMQGVRADGGLNWQSGLHYGLMSGVFFIAASMAINYLYQRRPLSLWLIDAGYQVVFLGIMGAVIGAFG